MKFFLFILLPFLSTAQATTYEPGDSTWITSSDTSRVKVYKEDWLMGGISCGSSKLPVMQQSDKPKYDTIGPIWKQVSDTTPGYNPVMAIQVYEVRVYTTEVGGKQDGSPFPFPHHFAWLDLKKKPFKLYVWQ
jgi:hypothetical protein